MRQLKWLVLGIMAAALCLPGLAVAEETEIPPGCDGVGLDETLMPSGQYVHVGDTICYEIWLAINAPKCDMQNVQVRFWRPDDEPPEPIGICASPGGRVIATNLYVAQGDAPIILDCGTYPELEYTVRQEDIVTVDGIPTVLAYVCITGTQLVGPPHTQGQDAKAIPNFVLSPCIDVTKEVDCDISKVGDEVVYQICVTNCGDADLFNVVVDDPHLGGVLPGFPSDLVVGQSVCLDFPYTIQPGDEPGPVENTVTATAEDQTGFAVSEFAMETVDLLHPDFTVTKTCLGPVLAGENAEFEIVITNTGDVRLDFTTDEAAIPPFSLDPGDNLTQTVTKGPASPPEICNEITVDATIPPEYCELPNVLTRTAGDCCPVCEPCVEVTKEVDCDISKVGDEVIYTICVTNCGDTPLTNLVVDDPHLGGVLPGFPSDLAVGQSVCLDFPYTIQAGDEPGPVQNQASVEATAVCGERTGSVSDVSEIVEVTLIHPDFTVTKTCLGPVLAGEDADFEIVITNTGDVRLDFTTDDPAIPPFSLDPGDNLTQTVTRGPASPPEICNEITVDATIPPEYCELPNVLTRTAGDCCPVCEPCVEVTKEVDCDISKVGDEVVYTICVTNCGDTDLEDVVVTDPHLGGVLAGFPASLAAGQTACVDFPYTIQPGDEPGPVQNQASVEADGVCDGARYPVSDVSEIVEVDLIHPDFTVTKTCLGPVLAGENAEFEIVITNTGDVRLDFTTDEAAIPPFSLDPGDNLTQTVTRGPASPPEICNEITVDATIPPEYCELPNVLTRTAGDCCPVCEPCVEVTKEVDCDISKVGDEVIYTICVTNCGDTELVDVVVTDSRLGVLSAFSSGERGRGQRVRPSEDKSGAVLPSFPSTLAPGQTVCLDFPYTIQPGDEPGPVQNQASVEANGVCDDARYPVSDVSEIVEVTLIHPDFWVTKSCMGQHCPGEDAQWEVVITNTGDVRLDFTTDEAAIPPFSLDPGDNLTQIVTKGPIAPPEICNEITVDATIPPEYCELPNVLTRTARDCCPVPTPCVEVTKEVDCDISKVGDEVIYTICVTNCGDVELVDVVVTDPHLGGVLAGFPPSLAPGQTACVDFPYTIQPGDEPGPVENQATVEATAACGIAGMPISDVSEIVEVTLIHPDFTVTKVCMDEPLSPGDDAFFEIVITNTGDVRLNFTTDEPAIPPFSLDPADFVMHVVTRGPATPPEICNEITVTATIPPEYCNLPNQLVRSAEDCCDVTGEDGCTPGYWKNHPACWCDRFDPDDLLGDVFAIPSELDYHSGNSLMDALNYSGGRLKGSGGSDATAFERAAGRMLFHAVAALLNGCHNDVAFPMTADGVIAAVNAALATLDMGEFGILHGILAGYNELGCPIDAHCRPHPEDMDDTGSRVDQPSVGGDFAQVGSSVDMTLGGGQFPSHFTVLQSVPNPFTHSVEIGYGLPVSGRVTVEVYDVAGRRVAALLDSEQPPGYHNVVWDGRTSDGRKSAPGIYFYRVRFNGEHDVKKMIRMED